MALPASRRQEKATSPPKAKKSVGQLVSLIPGGKCVWLSLFLVSLGIGWWLVFGDKGLYHLYSLRQERDRLARENLILKDEIDRMVKRIERLRHDREFIEDIIRHDLRYIKRNEIIYQLEPEIGTTPQVTQAPGLGPLPSPAEQTKKTPRAVKSAN